MVSGLTANAMDALGELQRLL